MNKKTMRDPLFGLDDDSAGQEGLNAAYIELGMINEDPEQPRKDYGTDEEREEIRKSIEDRGVIEPIILYKSGDEGYYIIAGHRRFRACRELGMSNIPAVIKDVDFSEPENARKEILLTQLEENLHRKNLSPIELANTYKIFQDEFKLSSREIAAKVQKSHHHVLDHLKLLTLPSDLLNKVVEGAPLTKVIEASKLEGLERKNVLDNLRNTSRDEIRKKNKAQNPTKNKGKGKVERGVPVKDDKDKILKKTDYYSGIPLSELIEKFNASHNRKPSNVYAEVCSNNVKGNIDFAPGVTVKIACNNEERMKEVINAVICVLSEIENKEI